MNIGLTGPELNLAGLYSVVVRNLGIITTSSSEAMIQASMIHLMLNRMRPDASAKKAEFRYERKPMKKGA